MDAGPGDGSGGYCLFVGRMEPDKGMGVLLESLRYLPSSIRIKIAGDGSLRDAVRDAALIHPNIEWCGQKSGNEVIELMQHAALLLFPSLICENFPVTIAEAYSVGLPVLASRRGPMLELIEDNVTGAFFSPADSHDLALQIRNLLSDRVRLQRMRHNARREFEQKYSPARNLQLLLEIYEVAVERARTRYAD